MEGFFSVIIAGSRGFSDYGLLKQKMDNILSEVRKKQDIMVISGTAKGADQLGERYGKENGFPISRHPAEWDVYGKSAGYRRNEEMADEGDALVAFWDGQSRGTANMIEIAKEKGLKIRIIRY